MKKLICRIKAHLERLSYRTGVIILITCIPFYILSFAQMALPLSMGVKSAMWVILFGLAKTFQYAGITILGAKGLQKLKDWWYKRRVGNKMV